MRANSYFLYALCPQQSAEALGFTSSSALADYGCGIAALTGGAELMNRCMSSVCLEVPVLA